MPDFYKIFGYAGAVPFVALTFLLFVIDNPNTIATLAIIQLAYAGMILSFLAGVHWAHALPRDNHAQIFTAMQPTILATFLLVMAFVTEQYGGILLITALGFPLLFKMDKKLLEADWLPKDYFIFRYKITAIATTCLVLSGISFWV